MLTIENISKLYKMDVGDWRIGKVETTNGAYLFQLYKFNRRLQIQINLERNPIGEQYELWTWDVQMNGIVLPHATPLRRLLDKSKLQTPELLIEQMKQLIK